MKRIICIISALVILCSCKHDKVGTWIDTEPSNEVFILPENDNVLVDIKKESLATYTASINLLDPEKTIMVTVSLMGLSAPYDRVVNIRPVPISVPSFINRPATEGLQFEFVDNPGLENPVILKANESQVTIPIYAFRSEDAPAWTTTYLQLELGDSEDLVVGLNGWLKTAIIEFARGN